LILRYGAQAKMPPPHPGRVCKSPVPIELR